MSGVRLCIIGLDCLTPHLIFDRYRERLPTFNALVQTCLWGPLRSSIPPITVPAWACMTTGCDPGQLGLYGFRDRVDHGYDRRRLASSLAFDPPPVWSLLSRAGLRCRVLGVPLTYPPKPVRGCLVSGPLTPDDGGDDDTIFSFPPEAGAGLRAAFGSLIFDVDRHRAANQADLLSRITAMTRQRFAIARAWAAEEDWDFFMMVDMGPDRIHHAFWHREDILTEYYGELDRLLGHLLAQLRPTDLVLVVSDHGAQSMTGGFALNQWLWREGYLTLRTTPPEPVAFDPAAVDWGQTRAWADGGYVGRIYLNIAGREPEGILSETEAVAVAAEIAARLTDLAGPDGERLDNRVLFPAEIYRALNGSPPDLLVLLSDLRLRALGSVGHPDLFSSRDDRGLDQANHAKDGVILMRDGHGGRCRRGLTLYDIAPTVLAQFGLAIPEQMIGTAIA